jgi:hypothetical protein
MNGMIEKVAPVRHRRNRRYLLSEIWWKRRVYRQTGGADGQGIAVKMMPDGFAVFVTTVFFTVSFILCIS